MLAGILGSIHNITFFQMIMRELAQAIRDGHYAEYREGWRTRH